MSVPRDPLSEHGAAGSDRGADDDVAARGVLEPEGGVRRRDQLSGPLDDALEHALEPLGRGEVAPELEQRLRALRLAALRLVETGVLERDGRMAGEHLEQPQVVLVELAQAELGDDDRPGDAGAVVERDGDDRLLDLGGALDLDRELAGRRIVEQERVTRLDHAAGQPFADARPEHLRRRPVGRGQLALECDRQQVRALADEDAAVVVIDQQPQLVRDRHPDLADVVRAVELAGQRLEHLQVRDRADVLAAGVTARRALRVLLVEEDDSVLAARLRGHHRRLGAGDELARVGGVLGTLGDADRDRDPAGEAELDPVEALGEPGRERDRALLAAARDDHGELLAADPADDVGRADARAEVIGELRQHVVADGVAEDVVDLLEVVDVDHHHRDVRVLGRGQRQLPAEPLVEVAVVVEAGQRVGLRLALEPRTDMGVVERQRGRVPEPLRELELGVAEGRVLADPVDVERPLEDAAGDQRDADQRLGIDRRARHEGDAGIEVRLVREHRLAVLDRPARDPDAERKGVVEDLVGVVAANEGRDEVPFRLVRLVDVQRLVRDDLVERVRDPDEQRVQALLGEQVVEDVCEPPVGVGGGRASRRRVGRHQPHARSAEIGCRACRFVHSPRASRRGRTPQGTHRTDHRENPACRLSLFRVSRICLDSRGLASVVWRLTSGDDG